jgi:Zn-finger nucleic acid-binding protein
MPRCPLCRSALVTIGFGLYPIALCTSCGARWIQDGHQQRAINQIQEPRSWPRTLARGPGAAASQQPNQHSHARSQRLAASCFLEARDGDPLPTRAAPP